MLSKCFAPGLIAGRIWWINRLMTTSSRSLLAVISIVVESGAIYSISLILLLSLYLRVMSFQCAVLDAVCYLPHSPQTMTH